MEVNWRANRICSRVQTPIQKIRNHQLRRAADIYSIPEASWFRCTAPTEQIRCLTILTRSSLGDRVVGNLDTRNFGSTGQPIERVQTTRWFTMEDLERLFNPSSSEPDIDSHVAKAGAVYTHFGEIQKAPVDVLASQKRTHGQSQQALMCTETDATKSSNCVYTPLKGSRDIRVLELHAGKYEAEITCTLHVCSTEFEYPYDPETNFRPYTLHAVSCTTGTPVWYTALSYVWGSPALVRPMTCNGKPFATTENLGLALRRIRRLDVAVLLWVDQICINQHDLQEKNQQVAMMGTIYQRAWTTLAWLGEDVDNSISAIDTILATKDALRSYPGGRPLDVEDFERFSLPAPDSPKWLELKKLMSRPWFYRVWIIQEVVLSHRIIIMCGAKCIPWADLSMFSYCMIDNDLDQHLSRSGALHGESLESGCIRVNTIDSIREFNNATPSKTPFINALVEGRSAQATNPRDKVYAIIGMTRDVMYPKYSDPVIDIYIETALKIATTSFGIDLLCCVDHLHPTPNQPSWVPDWATPRQTTSLGFYAKYHDVYRAIKKPYWEMQSRTEITENGAGLVITGFIVDSITKVGMISEEPELKDLLISETPTSRFVLEGMNLAVEACQPCSSYKMTLFETFWQTLVAGKDPSSHLRAPDEYSPIFALLFDTATGHSPSFPDQPPSSSKRGLSLENLQVRRPARTYHDMQTAMKSATKNRRLGVTAKRYLGLYPRGTQIGDQICVLVGACVPFVIRKLEGRNEHQLVGECYVHCIMDGEAENMRDLQKTEICLI